LNGARRAYSNEGGQLVQEAQKLAEDLAEAQAKQKEA